MWGCRLIICRQLCQCWHWSKYLHCLCSFLPLVHTSLYQVHVRVCVCMHACIHGGVGACMQTCIHSVLTSICWRMVCVCCIICTFTDALLCVDVHVSHLTSKKSNRAGNYSMHIYEKYSLLSPQLVTISQYLLLQRNLFLPNFMSSELDISFSVTIMMIFSVLCLHPVRVRHVLQS